MKEIKEKIIDIFEENWVFTARYNRKEDINSERKRIANEILELFTPEPKDQYSGIDQIILEKQERKPKEPSWEEEIRKYFIKENYQVSPNWVESIIKIFKGVLQSEIKWEREKFLNQPANQHDNEVRKLEREKIIKWAKDQWKDDAILPEDLINFLK